jgi:Polyketide cyclase / dehydrase and lipid transport
MPGVGKGRRMPVQQSVDVAVPVETAYNQFTQFEDWPEFMHRVTRVTQEDDCTLSFATKIWGKTKEFKAEIETQRPDERIKWRVAEGITHSGVVTFHELAPRLTRIELNLDVDPGSLIEKAARGMRAVKRAVRADLHRYKAFIEMQEMETGAWRGVIEDGELVEEHDDSYDEERDYRELEDVDAEEHGEEEEEEEETQQARTERFKRQAQRAGAKSGRASSGSGRSGGSSKSSGSSRSSSAKSKSSPKASGGSRSSGGGRSQGRSRGSSNGSGSAKRSSGSGSSARKRKSSSRS